MMYQNDKERRRRRVAEEDDCSTREVQHAKKERIVIMRLESTGGWRRVANVDDRVDREGWTVMRL